MKITKEKAEENRAALVAAAARLFREKGVDGVGVAEISKVAGLTHGALYAHFPSKEALAVEAMILGKEQAQSKLMEVCRDGEPDLNAFIDYYLAPAQRDNYAGSCALAAAASEIGRHEAALSAVSTESFLNTIKAFEKRLAANQPGLNARPQAMALMASMIGAVAMARATVKSHPEVSEQILEGAHQLVSDALNKH